MRARTLEGPREAVQLRGQLLEPSLELVDLARLEDENLVHRVGELEHELLHIIGEERASQSHTHREREREKRERNVCVAPFGFPPRGVAWAPP